MKKRSNALVAFKMSQESVTPRSAMIEVIEAANQSSAISNSLFSENQTNAPQNDGNVVGSFARTEKLVMECEASKITTSLDSRDISLVESNSSSSEVNTRRTRRKRQKENNIPMDIMDLEKDITRPSLLNAINYSKDDETIGLQVSDSSRDTTIGFKNKRSKSKKHYLPEDFDFSGTVQKKDTAVNDSKLEREDTLFNIEESLNVTSKLSKKRNKKVLKKSAPVTVDDFADIEPNVGEEEVQRGKDKEDFLIPNADARKVSEEISENDDGIKKTGRSKKEFRLSKENASINNDESLNITSKILKKRNKKVLNNSAPINVDNYSSPLNADNNSSPLNANNKKTILHL